ncbi:hypothetical protein QPB21_002147 [Vibrio alginolyticus]|nr:hypothetical protein [Vibrio alginolyticus]
MHKYYFFKGSAILSKLIFLGFVVPSLSEGQYGEYYFSVSVSLVISRLISFANEEYIPSKINENNKGLFLGCYFFLMTSSLFLVFIYFVSREVLILIPFLSSSLAANVTLGGIIRLGSPLLHCYLANMPFILFTVLCLMFDVSNHSELLMMFGFSMIFSQVPIFSIIYSSVKIPSIQFIKKYYFSINSFKEWAGKVLSNILVISNLRVSIIISYFLIGSNDEIAIALTISEIYWQLLMVWINKNYSHLMSERRNKIEYIFILKKYSLFLLFLFFSSYFFLEITKWFFSIYKFEFLLPIDIKDISLYQSALVMASGFSFSSILRVVVFSLEKFDEYNSYNFYYFQLFNLFILALLTLVFVFFGFSFFFIFITQGVVLFLLSSGYLMHVFKRLLQ